MKTPLNKLSEIRNPQIRLQNKANLLKTKIGGKTNINDSNNGEKPKNRAQSRDNEGILNDSYVLSISQNYLIERGKLH